MIGQRLLHYEIIAKLGEGGMGVVYKARDHHLDRFVALKVLPPGKVTDPERKRRFVQEARAASALNHPNIVTIHDIASDNGTDFIAMEYVAGKTLDAVIPRQGMPLNEALRVAIQVADGLAKAHAAGIMHRDLKPFNIMVDAQGRVKLLDFGLAKLTDCEEISEHDVTVTQGQNTVEGTIVGTASYMSPEQAEGKRVDARSDIFSFGAVLYEMVTGRRAFHGDTPISTLAAVIHKEPKALRELSPVGPRELHRIIARCLRKDRARRTQSMEDVRLALEELRDESDSGQPASDSLLKADSTQLRPVWPIAAVAALLATAAVGTAWWRTQSSVSLPPDWKFRRITFDTGVTTSPALSRDGNLLAYASDRDAGENLDIYVQPVSGGRPLRLTDHAADDSTPRFSPDASQIVFHSARDGGGIYIVSVLGGDARLLAKGGRSPQFSPDGKFVAFEAASVEFGKSELFFVPAGGGRPRKLETGLPESLSPLWSPDGRFLLFAGAKEQDVFRRTYHPYLIGVAGGPPSDLGPAAKVGFSRQSRAQWLEDGTLLFSASGDMRKVAVDTKRGRLTGPVEAVTMGAKLGGLFAADSRGVRFAVADSQESTGLWAMPIDGNQGKPKGELRRWTEGLAGQLYPTTSADGRRLVYTSNRSGNWDIYLRELDTGRERVVVATPQEEQRAQISPDGMKIAFNVFSPGGKKDIGVVPSTGGAPEKLCDDCSPVVGWTPDSRHILFYRGAPTSYFLLDATDGKIRPLLSHPKWDLHRAQFSPDGRWIAVNAKTSAERSAIYLVPYRDSAAAPEGAWIQVASGASQDGGPIWSPDGKMLYFYSERAGFTDQWAVRLDLDSKRPVGEPFLVAAFHSTRRKFGALGYTVTKDWIIWTLLETTSNLILMERENPSENR
jgi:serine/threonine protein kinase